MTDLTNSTADSKTNVMKNIKQIFTLPRWLKICLSVLSVVAMAGLIATFALMKWADGKVERAQLGSAYIDKHNTGLLNAAELENKKAYDARVYFERLDVLLRSKVIAYIDVVSISWDSQIDTNAIGAVKSQNRHLKFTTSQDLRNLNLQNLGTMEYKMDFSPLLWTIGKYFIIIFLCVVCGYVLCRLFFRELFWVPRHIVSTLKHTSLPQALYQGYKSIDPLYRHTFWIVFIALNIVFGFHTIHFPWGPDDWWQAFEGTRLFEQLWEGRYTTHIISSFIQDGLMSIILSHLITFIMFALSAVWLCIFLNIQKNFWIWVVIGLLLTLQPFILTRLFFMHQVMGIFIALAICILGFILAKKAGEIKNANEGGTYYPYILCLLAIVCIHWAIAAQQTFIDTVLILLCGGIIVIIVDEKGNLKIALYKSRFFIISIALAAISYKIILDILKKSGKTIEYYNNQMISLSDLPDRILLAVKIGFKNLFTYDVAFMPLSMTILFAIFLIVLLFLILFSSLKLSAKLSIFILLFLAVVSSEMHNILSKHIVDIPRNDFTGLLFLRILIVALVFKFCIHFVYYRHLMQNLLFILSSILIWVCIVQDLYAQRVQKFAFDAEFRLLNRVVDRIEQFNDFNYNKKYCGVMFGKVANMRERYYRIGSEPKYNSSMTLLKHTAIAEWEPHRVFNFVMQNNVFSNCGFYSSSKYKENQVILSLISRLNKAGILDTLEPWPSKNSVVVFEDIIVFVASKGNLDEIRQMVKTLP